MYTQRNVFIFFYLLEVFTYHGARAVCVWPSPFTSSTWRDSLHDNLIFGTNDMTGYMFTVDNTVSVSQWDCLAADTFSTDGKILLVSSNLFTLYSSTFYAYLCLTLTQVTEVSYRYYVSYGTVASLGHQRVLIYPVNTLTETGTICNDIDGASGGEYQMLIKSGQESSAKITCPWSLLARYGYTHTTSGGVTTCSGATSDMNMCTDTTQMTFDYTACSTKVAYSDSGTVWCVANVISGTTNYLTVYNGNDGDAMIDNSALYRFSCLSMEGGGSEASIAVRHCRAGQAPNQIPTDATGANVGARITFTSTKETCPTCPVLTDPALGNVTISTSDTVSTAVYECNAGYSLHGTSQRTCQADNTWTSTQPYCSCASPSSPSNGNVAVNTEGTEATYTCNVGYTISGSVVRSCDQSTASWDSSDPTCVECASLVDGSGRSYLQSTNGTTTQATYSCSAGYTLSGNRIIECLSDGTWLYEQPTCVACNLLTNPQSGSVLITTDGKTSVANYTCNTGYYMVGTGYRTCPETGVWNGTQPSCACSNPSTPSNGAVVADGTTAIYTCNLNYTLSGDETRTCQTDGTGWPGSDPTCTLCNTLSAVPDGSVAMTTTGTVTSAKYTCTQGYSLSGTSPITCSSSGSWSSTAPTCVECQALSDPSSGTVQLSTSGTRTSATYSCTSGYNLNGNALRLCNSDGTWTLTAPTCTCQDPTALLNGALVSDGSTATYNCSIGYSLNGVSVRTCGTDGSGWSGSDPTCVSCGTTSSPSGGNVTVSTNGQITRATYMCDIGNTLNGISPISCQAGGSWDNAEPTCAECSSLTAPSSGTVDVTSDGTTSTASFVCASAYYLSGSSTLTCQSTGQWSSTEPTCKCNFPSTPSNGAVSVTDGTSGTMATYTCVAGYTLNGLASRLCQTDGTGWEGDDPQCVVCSTLTLPTGGTFTVTTNNTHSVANFTCSVGTSLLGDEMLTCQSTGLWDKVEPTCVSCSSLSDPASGSVSTATSGTVTAATFSCVTGYTLLGSATLTCVAQTAAWDLTEPTCICSSPADLSNGVITRDPSTSSTVSYTCNTGYVLTGSETRTCLTSGTGWDGVEPSCEIVAVGQSTEGDSSDVSVPVFVVAILCFILLIVLVLLGIFIYLYRSINSSRIAANKDPPPRPTREMSAMSNKKVKPPSSRSIRFMSDTTEPRPESSLTATNILLVNGDAKPVEEVRTTTTRPTRLPKIQRPPAGHQTKFNQNKKSPKRIQPAKGPVNAISSKGKEMEEKPLDRLQTPDLLGSAIFNYIHPQYCYESDTPLETGRLTRASRKGKRIKT